MKHLLHFLVGLAVLTPLGLLIRRLTPTDTDPMDFVRQLIFLAIGVVISAVAATGVVMAVIGLGKWITSLLQKPPNSFNKPP